MSRVLVTLGVVVVALAARTGHAQEAPAAPAPANLQLNLTLTETMRRVAEEAAKRDDLRAPPPVQRPQLPEGFQMTVSPAEPQCWPGEDRLIGLERARRANRSGRPR